MLRSRASSDTATGFSLGGSAAMGRLRTVYRRLVSSRTYMRFNAATLAAAMLFVAVAAAQAQQQPPSPSGLGRAPTQVELRSWDISIGPEGAELPPGSGNS